MGEMIRTLRKQRGLTQAELAKLANIAHISVSRYEAGENPSLANAKKLADALNVTIDELLKKEVS